MDGRPLTVAIGGFGGIGQAVGAALNCGVDGLELTAISARDEGRARHLVAAYRRPPVVARLEELASHADIVVECAPASVYDLIARPALAAGRILVTMSSGALLARPDLFDATAGGGRIVVPSGGMLGLDGLAGAAEGSIESVELVTYKPPKSFLGAPYIFERGYDLSDLRDQVEVFAGNAREAAAAFPANANVAATLCLAGIGPERTQVRMWADPAIDAIRQEVRVVADSCRFTILLESFPLVDNPRTGSLTPKSVVATLRRLVRRTSVGT